jgi:hypothetical protein
MARIVAKIGLRTRPNCSQAIKSKKTPTQIHWRIRTTAFAGGLLGNRKLSKYAIGKTLPLIASVIKKKNAQRGPNNGSVFWKRKNKPIQPIAARTNDVNKTEAKFGNFIFFNFFTSSNYSLFNKKGKKSVVDLFGLFRGQD